MNWKDFISPFLFGIIFLVLSLVFSDKIILILNKKDISTDMFNFFALLFGLILTAYSMLFGVIPALKKEYRDWDVFKDTNALFISCLFCLLVSILFAIVYLFIQPYGLFVSVITLLGINIGFFVYIILLLKDIFHFTSKEGLDNH